ncbi:hypothetical protein HF563_19420 [Acidithiobacillus ferridurans]|nr:hypothetical protein [Acidithiobacillus ferridurans]
MQKRILSAASKLPPPRNPTVSIETINRYFTEITFREARLRLGAPDWLKAYINGPIIEKLRNEHLSKYQNRGEKRRYEADPIAYAKQRRPRSSLAEQIEGVFWSHRMNPARNYQQFVDVQRKLHLYPSYDDLVDPYRVEAVTAWRMGEAMLLLPVQWGDIWVIKRPVRGLLALKRPEQAVLWDIWGNLHGWTNGDNLPTFAEHLGYGKSPQFKNGNHFDLRPENVIQTQPRPAHRPMKCSLCGELTTAEESLVEKKKRYCLACLRHNVKVWS